MPAGALGDQGCLLFPREAREVVDGLHDFAGLGSSGAATGG
ncbi:MAG: hypothetical protein ABI456_01380 [Ktedonobacteraceae bacterium]